MKREPKIDFGDDSWSAHRQEHWLDFAGNPDFPDYLRIVFVAYGRHAANGHAKLRRGELARFLVRKFGSLPDRRTLWHALRRAIDLGFLTEESRLLCLVVSSDHVQGGRGKANEPCRRDHTIRQQNDGSKERRFDGNDGKVSGRSTSNDGEICRPPARESSISLQLVGQGYRAVGGAS